MTKNILYVLRGLVSAVILLIGVFAILSFIAGRPVSGGVTFATGLWTIGYGISRLSASTAPELHSTDSITFQELADVVDHPVRFIRRDKNQHVTIDKFIFPSDWSEVQKINWTEEHPPYK